MKKYFALLVGLLIILMLLPGCNSYGSPGTPGSSPTATAPPGQSTNAVTISGFAFAPATLTVKANTTVTWTNNDSVAHTVTADDGSFDSKNIAPGGTFSYTFTKSGNVSYHCAIHTYMKATVTVQ